MIFRKTVINEKFFEIKEFLYETGIYKKLGEAEEEQTELIFSTTLCCETDFQFVNFFMSTQPGTRFVDHRVVNMKTPSGYRLIDDQTYKEKENGRKTSYPVDGCLEEILWEKFRIEIG